MGADDVIEEVIVLLAKLETDRLESRTALQKERDRGKTLREKIDTLAEDRLFNLPKAVQKGECDSQVNIQKSWQNCFDFL